MIYVETHITGNFLGIIAHLKAEVSREPPK